MTDLVLFSWSLPPARAVHCCCEARRRPGGVQAVAPLLDLAGANEVWAPNRRVARALTERGFEQVAVRRLHVA